MFKRAPTRPLAIEPARYVIINDCDAPEPNMVCQWVANVGYCYMHRRYTKPTFDGMQGLEATPVEAFGFAWAEDAGGVTRFYRTHDQVTATYRDGQPRRWQHRDDSFEWRKLVPGDVKQRASA